MKNKKINVLTLTMIISGLMIITSCHRATVTNSACGNNPLHASWKVDGTSYEAISVGGEFGSDIALTIFACGPSGQLAPMMKMQIPHAFAAGTYDLRGRTGAEYILSPGGSYFTDNGANTGTLTIANVNMVDSTYSATFQFTAQDTVTHATVHITDGVLTDLWF